jgi:hypothetical protein
MNHTQGLWDSNTSLVLGHACDRALAESPLLDLFDYEGKHRNHATIAIVLTIMFVIINWAESSYRSSRP